MRLISFLGVVFLSLSMVSCEGLLDSDGRQVHQRVQVSMTLRKPVPAALINGLAVTGPSQLGTSLIVLVPEGTESTPFFEQIAGIDVLDQQLLDLTTSSVSLSVPLGVPVQLFEYTFNDTLTLEEILAGSPIAGSPNVSGAFTLGPEIFDETTGEASFSVLLSLQTTSILESFDAALNELLWERVDSDATVSGGELNLVTSAVFDGSADAAAQRRGAFTIVQSNRNLQLSNQRIAGTVRIDSFSTFDDAGAVSTPQVRAFAGLYYQPRDQRGTERTGRTGVRIMFRGSTGGTLEFVLSAFTCLNETCASVAAGDVEFSSNQPYSFSFAGAPTTDIPFELEYQGGGVFMGTFSGESLTVDLPALGATIFNENDFLFGRLQTQGTAMFDNADSAAITAVFDDIVVGEGPVAGIAVTPTGGLLVSETGTTATFDMVLTAAPDADVTIALSSSDTTEATISAASLTFTSTNWDAPQTVTVTGVDDFIVDGNTVVTIVTAAAVSTDARYDAMDASDVTVTVADNGAPGITLSTTILTTSELAAGSDSFTVVLNSTPTADVVIAVNSSDITEGTVAPASLTFTSLNWSTPQTVTVTGVDDFVDDGDVTYTISTTATSADVAYSGIAGVPITATNVDDDTAGFTVTPTAGLLTAEDGSTATYTVVLNSEPTADVTVNLGSNNAAEAVVVGSLLTFTSVNWNTPQVVTVQGVDDMVDDTIQIWFINHTVTSADLLYNGFAVPSVAGENANLIRNPSFEVSGFTGWLTQDLASPFVALAVQMVGTPMFFGSTAPTDGVFSMVTGWDGSGSPGATIFIAQDVFIPLGATSLIFDYQAGWDLGLIPALVDRTFVVNILPRGGGGPLQSIEELRATAGTLNAGTGLVTGVIDVTPFLGQYVRISFEWLVPESFSGPAGFELDNVLIQ